MKCAWTRGAGGEPMGCICMARWPQKRRATLAMVPSVASTMWKDGPPRVPTRLVLKLPSSKSAITSAGPASTHGDIAESVSTTSGAASGGRAASMGGEAVSRGREASTGGGAVSTGGGPSLAGSTALASGEASGAGRGWSAVPSGETLPSRGLPPSRLGWRASAGS